MTTQTLPPISEMRDRVLDLLASFETEPSKDMVALIEATASVLASIKSRDGLEAATKLACHLSQTMMEVLAESRRVRIGRDAEGHFVPIDEPE